ncbi:MULTISPECIES: UDP-N-acetylmuramoyl-L-alanine--D-glutamate ligase [Carnobacterium]|uniref:UDP-N-acetylmuramoylalanine--D-glutamate ligase n=1 Tax=Carnobacterium inhibens TaxID=147709 RepID=A0ABR7TB07_9LACT|nr:MULTISPECIES: UDP-N-acetylmuramoyl-L-alanine--D-glutamate ligase [Carnobacterium]MBC9825106.1 UDP-N-acetylmuramoyl-L-alanine--D-glutamate ligase [Carnobacterium inhibens]MCM3512868.1 UDP-N-acetylmuramoyl-L-alanine--D-glutamate ligase [Carnobacterium inhibens]MDN5371154.1 UDP-N-acetylmuramoylalanine--D-glutamate ligase [Carnobacterium sp.]
MKNIKRYEHKKVLVLGLALSGVNAAKLLHALGALVTVNDYKNFDENPQAQELLESGIRVVTGGHPVELLDEDFEWVVKNPGIMYNNPIIVKAIEKGIPVITEVELAYEVAESTIIGITGTNGKTTTTTMIAELLNAGRSKGHAYVAGNIGTPASLVAQKATADDEIVMELSSFQLMGITELKPHIAVITNIYSAHLDYHGTRDEYVTAKMNITKNQTEKDYLILNWDQLELRKLAKQSKAQIIPFSRKEILENGVYLQDGVIYYQREPIMAKETILVPGEHNVENAMAAIAVAKLLNQENGVIRNSLENFAGVKHRTQFVMELEERRFYNDSKATNTLATENALKGFDVPIILLAGGLDRGNDFDDLIPTMSNKVKALIVFGETAMKLSEAGKKAGIETIIPVQNVEAAVPVAYELSEPNDVILLSPACASWDQYRSFEVRGDAFIHSVEQVAEEVTAAEEE